MARSSGKSVASLKEKRPGNTRYQFRVFILAVMQLCGSRLLNILGYWAFFFTTRNYKSISPREYARKKNFKKAFERGPYYQGNKQREGWSSTAGGSGRTGKEQNASGQNAGGSAGNSARGAAFHTVWKKDQEQITKHRCAICGRTELDGDMLEFRFCSKCKGNHEYCSDHLYTHTHIE